MSAAYKLEKENECVTEWCADSDPHGTSGFPMKAYLICQNLAFGGAFAFHLNPSSINQCTTTG